MNGWSSGLFSSCLATAAAYCGDGRGRVNLEIHMYKESWLVYEMVRSKGSRAASMPLLRTYCLLLLLSSYWGCRYQHSTATSNVKLLFIITNDRGWTKRRSSHHSRRRPRRCSHNRCPHTTSSSHKVFSSCTTHLGRRRPRALTFGVEAALESRDSHRLAKPSCSSLLIAPASIGPVCSERPVGVAHVKRRTREIARALRANAQARAAPLTRLRR